MAYAMQKDRDTQTDANGNPRFYDRSKLDERLCGVTITTCGHYLHQSCLKQMRATLRRREEGARAVNGIIPQYAPLWEGKYTISWNRGEFLCPYCKSLSNCLLPIEAESESPSE